MSEHPPDPAESPDETQPDEESIDDPSADQPDPESGPAADSA